jgi:ABC-2 type transport system ATP-binding protein
VSYVVQSDSLTKRYGGVVAVDDLTFNIEAGTITGFLGPNGAGKSTTLRMLLGLAKPTRGHATIFGKPYDELETPALRIGAVLEATDFHPGRSGRDHLRMLSRAVGLPDSRVDEVLSLVELQDAAKRRVKGYSACVSASDLRRLCSVIPIFWCWTNQPTGSIPKGCDGCVTF